jgi:DNA-binding CsgD family transcriptional regulator
MRVRVAVAAAAERRQHLAELGEGHRDVRTGGGCDGDCGSSATRGGCRGWNSLPTALGCGASALADRIRGDLGAGGGRPARLERSGIDALTPPERRTCDLASSGLGSREVARTLFVTERTVELHLTSAYRKLGIRSRYQPPSVLPPPATE